jgi:PAS domain S-box-containing protein
MMSAKAKRTATARTPQDVFSKREESFRALIESSPDVFTITSVDGLFEYISPAVHSVLGYIPSELIGRSGWEFVHPDEVADLIDLMGGLLTEPCLNGPLPSVRYRCKHKDGSWRQMESRGFSSWVEGHVLRVVTISRDISEQSRAETALQENRERLALALDAASLAPWESDVGSGSMIASTRLFDLFGLEDNIEEYSRRDQWLELVIPEDRPQIQAATDRAVDGSDELLVEFRIRRASDGGVRWIRSQGRIHPDPKGQRRRLVGVASDITESRLAAKALSESEERFRRVVENISDALVIDDAAGNVIFANEQFAKLFGLDANRIGPIALEEYVSPEYREELRDRHDRRIRGEEVPTHFEYEGIRADGERIWLEVDVTPVTNEKGEVTGTQSAIRDITSRKRAEQALKRSSRRFSLLAWTSNQLLLAREPATTLRQLGRHALAEMGCELFLSYLAQGKLQLDAVFGLSDEATESVRSLEYGESVCGIAAEKREARIVEHVQECEFAEAKTIRSWGLRAFACYPLTYREKIVGTLAFGTFSRDHFNPDELFLMESFSNQVAIAMGRGQVEGELLQMHAKEQEHAAELERRVQERTEQVWRANEEINKRSKTLESLTRELTETENRERRRMAEMLHDGLQQVLVGAQLSVRALQASATEDQNPEIERLTALLAEALQASRSLTYDLCPPALSTPGLGAAFVWLAAQMREKHGLNVEIEIQEDVEPSDESAKIILFNGVRELLFNVVKHAKTSAARVALRGDGAELVIQVSDAGAGFDARKLALDPLGAGFGLFSIRERMALFGGSVKIDSTPGLGTVARLIAPRKQAEGGNQTRSVKGTPSDQPS